MQPWHFENQKSPKILINIDVLINKLKHFRHNHYNNNSQVSENYHFY